jgi:hypothetical protein
MSGCRHEFCQYGALFGVLSAFSGAQVGVLSAAGSTTRAAEAQEKNRRLGGNGLLQNFYLVLVGVLGTDDRSLSSVPLFFLGHDLVEICLPNCGVGKARLRGTLMRKVNDKLCLSLDHGWLLRLTLPCFCVRLSLSRFMLGAAKEKQDGCSF